MGTLRVLWALRTVEGRRVARSLWWIVRHNRETLEPTSDFVTVSFIGLDGRLTRVHRVPSRMVEGIILHAATRGERVLIGQED